MARTKKDDANEGSKKTTKTTPKRTTKTSKKAPARKVSSKAVVPVSGPQVEEHLPVVGIGASAGGLEAFEQFFTHMPPDAGIAFVLVQHLDPTHKSILTELVKRFTSMDVMEVEDSMTLEANTVFVIPPNRYMAIFNGRLHLLEPTEVPGLRTPIDYFFRSLAEDQKERAICIVLSGTGTEGALGLRAVKGEGGMAMVQEPESAKYDGMPRNAIATGLADYVLPPQHMPEQLISYVEHALFKLPTKATKPLPKENELLEKVFLLVRARTGNDFSNYKHNTILRRIDRRMAVHQITRLSDYVRYLQLDPRETDILFKELLIGVTNFFRDRDAFDILREEAIAKLFEQRSSDQPIRIWVPGCATGEEAYTIAILCREVMDRIRTEFNVQIFATDIDNDAIETARLGIYPASISVDVAPEALDRYFAIENNVHRVKKDVRDMVVFALQNVITDPPFSKMDLISCRNLLIYLGADLQKKVLPLFHYSLRKDGFLFLGSSETIGEFFDYFSTVNRKWKLFKRKESEFDERHMPDIRHTPLAEPKEITHAGDTGRPHHRPNLRQVAEGIILKDYGPTAVVINEKNEILYVLGRAGRYLEPTTGRFPSDILAMAREGLRLELATAIRKASLQRRAIRVERLLVKTNGDDQLVNLVVKPISHPTSMKGTHIVIFEDVSSEACTESDARAAEYPDAQEHPRVRQLEQELKSTKEYLQTTIEELETSNEELKSTNEELQSSNEELQSTNEELETSKEELQSVNEELTTVNSEHQQKIEELSKTSSDLNNLLASTEVGTIFLDKNLHIQRFTPSVTDFINLIHTDIGRPVSHIVSNIDYDGLVDDAKEVLRRLVPKEQEVKTKDGRWYQMRVLPYRTTENVIDGVVITYVDITKLSNALAELEKARERELLEEDRKREFWETVADTAHEAILILSEDFRVELANQAFFRLFNTTKDETDERSFFEIGDRSWDRPTLRSLLEQILPEKTVIVNYRVEDEFPGLGKRIMQVNAKRLETSSLFPERIILAIQDITELRNLLKEQDAGETAE